MDKKAKTNITKNERNHIKKNVNPFKINDNNYYSSKRLGVYELNDSQNIKKMHFSDRKLIKINFQENKCRKSLVEVNKIKCVNELLKLKSSINSTNLSTIQISSINNKNIYKWKEILYNHNQTFSITQLNESKNYNDDEKIINQCLNETDESNKILNSDDIDVLKKDVLRTRVNETKGIKEYMKNLELLIKFFLKESRAKYKQGLNEIIGAFLSLKYSNINIKEEMTLSEIYNLLNGFINLFVYNYYYDESIYSIKNSFSLLGLLMKYHSPEIFNIFERGNIFPEMYATSWLLTVFAYKLKLNTLFYFWNKIILENDQLIIHYLIVALLIYKKDIFVNLDIGSIPIIINRLSIETEQDIDIIFEKAIDLRKKTPYSFRLLAQKLDVLKHRSNQHKIKYELYHPDTLVAFPIFPSEVFYICYKNAIKCPDENHIKNINMKANCEHCDMKIEKDINYILFDLRISEKGKLDSNNEKSGFLPQVIMINKKEINEDNLVNLTNNRFNEVKNKYHFIFITSKIDCLNNNKENGFNNINNISINKHKGETKIIHLGKKINKKYTHIEKTNIKESDNLKNLLLFLIENNYQYISYIYGGFEAVHNEIMNNKKANIYSEINLINHNDEKCHICKKNKKSLKTLSPKVNKIKLNLKALSPKKLFISNKNSKSKDKIKENKNEIKINKTESNIKTNINRIITLDEVNKMISKSQQFAAPCKFTNKENININTDEKNNHSDNQGLLIMCDNKLFAIKTPTYNNKPIEIIYEIMLNNIKNIKIKAKFYVHINFNNMSNEIKNKETLVVKFNYEQDSEKFLNSINKVKKLTLNK